MSEDLVVEIESKEELDKVTESGDHLVVDYTAAWCGPCKRFTPVYQSLAQEHTGIKFYKVDIDKVRIETVQAVPTFEVYAKGKLQGTFKGADRSGLVALLSKTVE